MKSRAKASWMIHTERTLDTIFATNEKACQLQVVVNRTVTPDPGTIHKNCHPFTTNEKACQLQVVVNRTGTPDPGTIHKNCHPFTHNYVDEKWVCLQSHISSGLVHSKVTEE